MKDADLKLLVEAIDEVKDELGDLTSIDSKLSNIDDKLDRIIELLESIADKKRD